MPKQRLGFGPAVAGKLVDSVWVGRRIPTRWGCLKENAVLMDLDELFEGLAVTGAPLLADEYGRKMPGNQDANGDHN